MSLREVDTVKMEKEKAMLRYQRFKNMANIARTLELCFAFIFLSWSISRSSAYFPAIAERCGFLMFRLCSIVVSQHFIFLLGNLIIITLFVKSGRSGACNSRNASSADDGDSLIRQFLPPQESVNCDILEEEEVSGDTNVRRSRRTRSEEFELEVTEKVELRRSETEPRRKTECSEEESTGRSRRMTVEDLSNEEFQRKVEAFIERQQRFLREESLSMVIHDRSSGLRNTKS